MTAIDSTQIEVIVYVCSFFSALACLSVICCYYFIPQVRTFVTKIIFYLAIAEFFAAIFRYVQDCTTFALLSQFTNLSSMCWMASVAIVQYLTVVKHYRVLYKYELLFHVFNWGFPLINTIIIGISNGYGDAGIWCWIKSSDKIGRWIGYFLWLLIAMIILFYCFGGIVFVLEHRLTSSLMPSASLSHQNTKQFQREIVLYLTISVFMRIWSVMDRFYDLVSDNDAPDLIKDLHAIGSCLEGFFNCLLLFYNNRTLRQRLAAGIGEKWRRYQQTKEMKSLAETEPLFPQRDDTSVQGHNNLNEDLIESSISSATVFVKGTREYSELYPHWTEDYLIDANQGAGGNDYDILSRSHRPHEAPKSAKLLQTFRVHVATWDSQGSTLYIDDYGKWLPIDNNQQQTTFQKSDNKDEQINKDIPELVIVSTQHLELADVAWEQRVQQQIGFSQYVKVLKHRLRDHHFILFVRKDVKHLVSNKQIASTGSSYEQFYGNKGGLAIAIDFAGLKLGFVGIDLLNEKECDINEKSRNIQGISHGLWIDRPEIDFNHQFNAIFWMGNINSCIENGRDNFVDLVNVSEEEEKKDIEDNEFNILLQDSLGVSVLPPNCHKYYSQDQCYILRKEGRIFHQNHEVDVTFNPTYCLKLENGKERYERSIVPRWCSRILYGVPSHPMVEIIPKAYNSVNHLFGSSNHRAVYGEFLLNRYNSWFPIPQTCWKFYLRNFQVLLYKTRRQRLLTNENDNEQNGNENQPATMYYAPKVSDYNALYLTVHAPFLDDTLRTPLGKLVQETSEFVVISIPTRIDFEKLFDERDVRNMGNFCLNIVLRDENLLGDMDSIAACSVPLLHDEDINKDNNRNKNKDKRLLMNDEKDDNDAVLIDIDKNEIDNNNSNNNDVPLNSVEHQVVYYKYESALTCDTAKRGRVEGLIAMRQKRVR